MKARVEEPQDEKDFSLDLTFSVGRQFMHDVETGYSLMHPHSKPVETEQMWSPEQSVGAKCMPGLPAAPGRKRRSQDSSTID